jgi:hypothetical protein
MKIMLKRILLVAALAILLPAAALADEVDFVNSGGLFAGAPGGLTLVGSTLIEVDGLSGGPIADVNLGSVNFVTGALLSGISSLQNVLNNQTGEAIFGGGGAFIVTSNGSDGLPLGTLFSGSFVGPVTWSFSSDLQLYTLIGSIVGTDFTGGSDTGSTQQFVTDLKIYRSLFGTTGPDNIAGITQTVSAPEPGTLVMMGLSFMGLAGAMKRKLLV